MDAIRTIAMSICVTAVVTSIFSMLVPNASMEKALKFGISLFFLTGLVSPFLNNRVDFHIDLDSIPTGTANQQMTNAVENQFSSLAGQRVAAAVENVLVTGGIHPKKVTAAVNITEDGSISINNLTVLLEKNERIKEQAAKDLILKETGIKPGIVYE